MPVDNEKTTGMANHRTPAMACTTTTFVSSRKHSSISLVVSSDEAHIRPDGGGGLGSDALLPVALVGENKGRLWHRFAGKCVFFLEMICFTKQRRTLPVRSTRPYPKPCMLR